MPSGASALGGPVYDARVGYQPDAAQEDFDWMHLHHAIDVHLFGGKSHAAEVYSHVFDAQPDPASIAMMGLARERDLILQLQSRQWEYPFPGAELGALPSVSRAPDTTPIIGPVGHLTHHAHQIESKRATRARFG